MMRITYFMFSVYPVNLIVIAFCAGTRRGFHFRLISCSLLLK